MINVNHPRRSQDRTVTAAVSVGIIRAVGQGNGESNNINNTDTRQIGTVFTVDISGIMVIPPKSRGALAELPDPEPKPEPDPEPVEAE